jgi:micrococcal nuclease
MSMGTRAIITLGALIAVAVAGCGGGGDGGEPTPTERAIEAKVVRVVDGDTIVASVEGDDQYVRYIGVDTPETVKPRTPVQCFGKAASAYNHRLIEGEEVRLRYDRERRDRYGRLLAYVYRARDGLFVNAALVRGGYATTLTIPPNTEHASQFASLERRARDDRRGLWRACPAG